MKRIPFIFNRGRGEGGGGERDKKGTVKRKRKEKREDAARGSPVSPDKYSGKSMPRARG